MNTTVAAFLDLNILIYDSGKTIKERKNDCEANLKDQDKAHCNRIEST